MDFLLTDAQCHLRARLRALVDAEIRPRALALDNTAAVPWDVARRLADEGILGIPIPEAHGGTGPGSTVEATSIALAREELARGSANVDLLFAMQGLGSYPITLAGSEAQKRKFLPPIARGESLAGYAVTEPGAGSDLGAIATVAERRRDHWILNGRKTFISNAGVAGIYTVFAKTDPQAGAKGLSTFVVSADTKGFEVLSETELMAPHSSGELLFRDCAIPADHILGEPGHGFRIAMATFDVFRPSVGAAAIGMAQAALEDAIAHARSRIQFGQPLADFQSIQFKIADMATELDAARLLVYRAARLRDTGTERVTKEASMAKLFATEAASRAIDEAVQIHGGLGVKRGTRVELLYRQVRALRIYEGASEIQRLIIAREVLRSPAAASGSGHA